MPPLEFAFTSYAIIGLTLIILATSIAVYLLTLSAKSQATWSLIVFFGLVSLTGVTTLLTNGLLYWDTVLAPWQDFWILAGAVALAVFAYSVPVSQRSAEATVVLACASGLALVALAYCTTFTYRFFVRWQPDMSAADAYYLLLPLGTLFVVIVFLRRSAALSRASSSTTEPKPGLWHRLVHPVGNDATVMRNLALALSLAFLPAVQTLLRFAFPVGFILSNIGAILAIVTIALVYFNYAPEVTSFMAKMVGITLATVLLIFAVFGSIDVLNAAESANAQRVRTTALIHHELEQSGTVTADSPEVAYVVTWDAQAPEDVAAYRAIYRAEGDRFDLGQLVGQNQEEFLAGLVTQSDTVLAAVTQDVWRTAQRLQTFPENKIEEPYQVFLFDRGGQTFEIGFALSAAEKAVNPTVVAWLLLILASSAIVLLGFPLFFRRTLVRPMSTLLEGITKVNRGELDTRVPIRFNDEIGSLTASFNTLTQSLQLSQMEQDSLLGRLRKSYRDLEEKVSDRTRELSAFTELTMLSNEDGELSDILQPALDRVMALGLCDALCLHLLSDDHQALELVAYRRLAPNVVDRLGLFSLPLSFSERIKEPDVVVMASQEMGLAGLPPELSIDPYDRYFGGPLMAAGRLIGWLSCYRDADTRFTQSEVSLLAAVARQMGIIVENQRLRQRIKVVATYEERSRLARDLHDSVSQLVYSMTLFTRSSQEALEDGDTVRLHTNLGHLADTSIQTLREMRIMLFELQPPSVDEIGLAAALDTRFDLVERRLGVDVDAHLDEGAIDGDGMRRELYFVAIEALNNALKHAEANHVTVLVGQEDRMLRLCIEDNGKGFDPAATRRGLGIGNMRQRVAALGGTLQVDSRPGRGTRVVALLPL